MTDARPRRTRIAFLAAALALSALATAEPAAAQAGAPTEEGMALSAPQAAEYTYPQASTLPAPFAAVVGHDSAPTVAEAADGPLAVPLVALAVAVALVALTHPSPRRRTRTLSALTLLGAAVMTGCSNTTGPEDMGIYAPVNVTPSLSTTEGDSTARWPIGGGGCAGVCQPWW